MAFHEERVAPLEVLIKLSGGEYRFAIDTGSSQTTFDNRLLPLLRRNARSSRYFAPGGNRTVDSYRSPAFHMGALRIEPLDDIHCEDLTMLSANGAARMDGVLGMDAIRAFVMALDFDAGKLRFFAKCPDERSAISIPLKRRNGVPVVNAVLGALGPRDFVIDTGCNIEAALSDDLFRTLARSEKLFLVGNVDATSAMGTHGLRLGVLESTLELGHCKVRNMVVCELPISEQRFNVLGLDYLLRYTVVFDFPNSVMYLRPREPESAMHPAGGLAGLRLCRQQERIIIHSVSKGSRSDHFALREGDILESVNGVRVAELRDSQIVAQLSGARRNVKLQFRPRADGKVPWLNIVD